MINKSKLRDKRFWEKWKKSGAVGGTGTALDRKLKAYDCEGQSLEGIDEALKKGYILRAFLSGGGLRVIRIEDGHNGPLKGYGEHPNLKPALRRASKDYLSGGKPYECVYLTGTTQTEDNLDLWVKVGRKLWAEKKGEEIHLEARAWNYKPVISATGETFEKAYKTLNEMVTEEVFKQARVL